MLEGSKCIQLASLDVSMQVCNTGEEMQHPLFHLIQVPKIGASHLLSKNRRAASVVAAAASPPVSLLLPVLPSELLSPPGVGFG